MNQNKKIFESEEKDRAIICRKTADIFEKVKNTKIEVSTSTRANNHVSYSGGKWYINATKNDSQSTKTVFERLLSHVVFESPNEALRLKMSEITEFAQGTNFSSLAEQMTRLVYESLEEKRVTSNYGTLYRGANQRFNESNLKLGQQEFGDNPENIKTPVQAIQAACLGLTDLVAKSQYPEANQFAKSIEGTGVKASIIATNEYVQRVLKPWVLAQTVPDQPEPQQGQGEGEGDDSENSQDSEGQGQENSDDKSDDDSEESEESDDEKSEGDEESEGEGDEESETEQQTGSKPKITEQKAKELMEDINKEYQTTWNVNHGRGLRGCNPFIDLENDKLEDQDNEQEIEQIEEKIAQAMKDQQPQKTSQVKIEHRIGKIHYESIEKIKKEPFEIDHGTANKLKHIFKRISAKATEEISDFGTGVDVDLYIKNRLEGGCDFLTNPTEKTGFAVVIGIDESGSMSGGSIQMARKLCGTLYKAFEGVPNTDIYVFGWTSGDKGTHIKPITKLSEVGALSATSGTPFLEATWFCADFIKKLKHRKKLFFQITDGDVAYDSDLDKFFAELRKTNVELTGIQITSAPTPCAEMQKLFGKQNFIFTDNMSKISGDVIKQISTRFMRMCGASA